MTLEGFNPTVQRAVALLLDEIERGAVAEPAAVFDFDDTVVIGDIGELALRRQVEELLFGLTPEHFDSLLPREPLGVTHIARAYGGARIADLSADLAAYYAEIHGTFEGMAGDRPLSDVRETSAYRDFVVKANLLFDGLIETEGLGKSWVYPWTARFFAGLCPDLVTDLSRRTWLAEAAAPLGERLLVSPETGAGKAGPQRLSIRTGIRFVPAMKALFDALEAAGVPVYVVTASLEPIVAATATEIYGLRRERVFGMRAVVKDGLYTDEVDERDGYAATFGPGKTRVIRNFIRRAPVLVAGDSDTDYDMLTAFPETRVRLVIDRGKGGAMAELYEKARRGEDGVVLQGRDDRLGVFVPK